MAGVIPLSHLSIIIYRNIFPEPSKMSTSSNPLQIYNASASSSPTDSGPQISPTSPTGKQTDCANVLYADEPSLNVCDSHHSHGIG